MENIRAEANSSSSVQVSWEIPYNLQFFPPGLDFSVRYQTMASWSDPSQYHEVDTTSGVNVKHVDNHMEIDIQVPFANTNYKVSVRARSTVADPSSERFWSESADVTVRSLPDRPCKEPEMFPGSFEVTSGGGRRNVTLHWSQMEASCENGERPGYEVVMHSSRSILTEKKAVDGRESTWIDFGDLSPEIQYDFELRSRNAFDYSSNSSRIRLPAAAAMPLRVGNVIKIGYSDTLFEVQWSPSGSSSSPAVTSYTIFWCHSVRENPVRCLGQLHAVDVAPDLTSTNITVPDARSNYQFGVSAVGADDADDVAGTSGIVWSSCIINANGPNSLIQSVHVSHVTWSTIDISWSLPCTPQSGIITGYNIYYCHVVDTDCLGGSLLVQHIEADLDSYSIENLEPFALYKISMSVQTRVGEGEISTPLFNRTAAGKPSPVMEVVTDAGNETVSVSWIAPRTPNGDSVFYKVWLNDAPKPVIVHQTSANLSVESYTDYNLTVQACNTVDLCSSNSQALTFRTRIGVPSEPKAAPTVQMKPDNYSLILINWLPPEKLGGLTYHYIVLVNSAGHEKQFTVNGSATSLEVESDDICSPDNQLGVKVAAVNQAEDRAQLLVGPWSAEGFFPCPTSGLAVGYILLIAFAAAVFVLVVAGLSFFSRRAHIEKEKARVLTVRMPWESEISLKADNGDKVESILRNQNKIVNHQGNYYGLLKSKWMDGSNGNTTNNVTTVIPLSEEMEVSSDQVNHRLRQGSVCEIESATNSVCSRQASEESANTETATVSESGNVNVNFGAFTDLADVKQVRKEDVVCSQFNAVVPESFLPVGTADARPITSSSTGYVTLGQANCLPASPSNSPNLSISSNDSLISKADRSSSRASVVKSAPLQDVSLSTSPGYVSFKSCEPVACETTGYVAIGAAPPDASCYVKMGVQPLEKPDASFYV